MELRKTFHQNSVSLAGSLFLAAIFFLSAADQTFTTRFMGFNFRWGQLLLLICALPGLWDLKIKSRENAGLREFLRKLFPAWAFFFLVYFLAAAFSPEFKLTFIKGIWGIFNLTCAAAVCLGPRFKKNLETGFLLGILLISLLIWAQALAIHWLEWPIAHNFGKLDCPITYSFLPFSIPLGYAQWSLNFENFLMFRPNAFYYEPSYAGAALSFAFPLILFLEKKKSFGFPPVSPLVAGAIVLIGSRLGILNLILIFLTVFIGFWIKQERDWNRHLFKSAGLGLLLLIVFALHPGGSRYFRYLAGPLGVGQIISHVQNYQEDVKEGSTEGIRVKGLLRVPEEWLKNPVWGKGVPGMNPDTQGLAGGAANTWAEVLLESGLLGFLAFLGAIVLTMRFALSRRVDFPAGLLVTTAWVVHFLVNLNLTQTFPRLDYWLLFFFSVYLLIQPKPPPQKPL